MYEQFLSTNGEIRAVVPDNVLVMTRIGAGDGNYLKYKTTVLSKPVEQTITIDPNKDVYRQVQKYEKFSSEMELGYGGNKYLLFRSGANNNLFQNDVLKKDVLLLGNVNIVELTVKDKEGKTKYLELGTFNNMVVYRLDGGAWTRYDPKRLDLPEYKVVANDGYEFSLSHVLRVLNTKLSGKYNNLFYDKLILDTRNINRSLAELGIEIKSYKFNEPTSLYSIPSKYLEIQRGESAKQEWLRSEKPRDVIQNQPQRVAEQHQNKQKQDIKLDPRVKELYDTINKIDKQNVATSIQNLLSGKYSWIWFGVAKSDFRKIEEWFKKYFDGVYTLSIIEDSGQRVKVRVDPVKSKKDANNDQSKQLWLEMEKKQTSNNTTIDNKPDTKQATIKSENKAQNTPLEAQPKAKQKEDEKKTPNNVDLQNNKQSESESNEAVIQDTTIPGPLTFNQISIFANIYGEKLKTRDTGQYLGLAGKLLGERSEREIYIMLGLNPDQMIRNKELMQRTYLLTGAKPMSDAEHLAIVLAAISLVQSNTNTLPEIIKKHVDREKDVIEQEVNQKPTDLLSSPEVEQMKKDIEKELIRRDQELASRATPISIPSWLQNVVKNIQLNPDNIDGLTIKESPEQYYSEEEISMLKLVYEREFKDKMSWEQFVGLAVYYFEKPVEEVK